MSINKVKVSLKDDSGSVSENVEYFQETGNWRKVIFLPYCILLKSVIVVDVIFNCLMVFYCLFFCKNQCSVFDWCYYSCEVIYLAFVILTLMHRYMAYRKTQIYIPKPISLVIVDILTLLPFYEVYYLLKSKSTIAKSDITDDYTRIKVVGRLTTVAYYCITAGNEPGLNHIFLTIMKQFITFCLYAMSGGAIWYTLLDTSENEKSWRYNLKYHQFNSTSPFDWFIICYTLIGNCYAHNYSGLISPQTTVETMILTITMIVGYLVHVMIFFGRLITQYIKKMQDQVEFSYRLRVMTRMLDNWDVEHAVKKNIIDMHNVLWERRRGQRRLPRLFRSLPEMLQKECMLDVFWHCIRHSRLFIGADIAFVRNTCLKMECECYMPGEYLYRMKELKTKMVYIVSGVVQILSQEDQESPVMSFSGGTILSEMACIIGTYSNVNIRCATYCEVQTIDIRNICRLFVKYPNVKHTFRQKLHIRLGIARTMQHKELLKLKDKEQTRTSIRWIKTQWRNIAHLTKTKKEHKQKYIMPHHVSKYLHLYVLSEDVELKMAAICLKSSCPFIFEPRSTFKLFCGYVVMCSVILQTLMIPYTAVFIGALSMSQLGFLYMMDVIYVFGLYVELSTAIKESGHLISKISEIVIYKVKRSNILIDIISTIPFELIGFLIELDPQVEALLHSNRCLKIYRVFGFLKLAELNVWNSYMRIRLIKFSLLFIFSLYFISCFLYLHTCAGTCEKIGWYHYNNQLMTDLGTNMTERLAPFITSFNFAASILLNLTWSNYYSYSIKDLIIEHAIVVGGYYLHTFCFAQLGACAVLQLKARSEYQHYLKGLKHFMSWKNVPNTMKEYMYTMIQCQWNYNDRHDIAGPEGILSDLPSHIKDKILIQRLINCMKMSPLFMQCKTSLLVRIANVAKIAILPPGTVVVHENTIYPHLNFILRGYCKAESIIPTDKYHNSVAIMSYGDCFPIMEMLMELNTFLKVTTLTFVELVYISRRELLVHLQSSLSFYEDLKDVMTAHMTENYIVLTRQKGRLPEMIASKRALEVGTYFNYATNEKIGRSKDKDMAERIFKNLGKWKFIRHIFLGRTFITTDRFYIIWECFRCSMSFIQILYSVFVLKFIILSSIHQPLNLCFFGIGTIDMYIRLHACYYNKDGILITHPLYTAKHYIKTSFLLDLYCVFPFSEVNIQYMFGRGQRYHTILYIVNLTRPLLFYRIFNGITYIQEQSKEGRAILFQNLKYILLVFVILAVLALFLHGLTCSAEIPGVVFYCSNYSWLKDNNVIEEKYKGNTATLSCYYLVLMIFSNCFVNLYSFKVTKEIIILFGVTSILFGIRWFVLAKITSSRIGGNTMLVRYQHNMKVLLRFVRQNYVNKSLVNEMVSHYEYQWKRTKGYNTMTIFHNFHPVLESDFSYLLYGKTLKICEIFSGCEDSDIRFLCQQFTEIHFKKGAHIIRCNDVAKTIYVVHKGMVDITVANDKLCTLHPGGIFGCLKLHGMTRQTICVKAVVHVDLLTINSSTFNTVIAKFPNVKKKLKRAMFLNTEYIMSLSKCKNDVATDFEASEEPGLKVNKKCKYFLINIDNPFYLAYNFVANVHISTISSIFLATLITKVGKLDIVHYYYYMYLFDVIFYVKILIEFHLPYMDPESGVLVKTFSTIWRRYLRSPRGFWLDVFTCMPFEVISQLLDASHEVYRICCINRTFRFIFMIKYYNNCRNTLTVSKHLRWSYLVYTLSLLVHLMACVWWRIACFGQKCEYKSTIGHEKVEFLIANSTVVAYRHSHQHVIDVFTGTGFKDMSPRTTAQLVTAIFMVGIAQFTQLFLTIGFASMLLLEELVMLRFERGADHVLQFMKATNLSISLKNKIWTYYVMLWSRGHGFWIPELLTTAPPYLKQDIMGELYGKHITDHFLFKKTHVDFIRQLVVHLQACVFMPGMYIAEKGDTDWCMYFIVEGEVLVYDKHGNNEIEQMVLMSGRSFGESQGLFGGAHDRSYKARFLSKVLSLKKSHWEYLLEWFPASKEHIIEQASRHFRKSTLCVMPLTQLK